VQMSQSIYHDPVKSQASAVWAFSILYSVFLNTKKPDINLIILADECHLNLPAVKSYSVKNKLFICREDIRSKIISTATLKLRYQT
jgi:hypothetical protein